MKPLGVILAGGGSRRMGRDKAAVVLAGRSMLDWVADALATVCEQVVTVGKPSGTYPGEVLPDEMPGPRGPLAGIVTGLAAADGRPVLAVGVDHPWVRPATLVRLAALAEGAVPIEGGVRQVTCALYPAELLDEARLELLAGGSVQSLLDRVPVPEIAVPEWTSWGEDGRSWFSADDPEALTRGLERYGPPG